MSGINFRDFSQIAKFNTREIKSINNAINIDRTMKPLQSSSTIIDPVREGSINFFGSFPINRQMTVMVLRHIFIIKLNTCCFFSYCTKWF